jgi:hypothetical protein
MTDGMSQCRKSVFIVCFGFISLCLEAAQFVEISAAIETSGYRLEDTNSMAWAKPKTVNILCIAGLNQWSVETDFQGKEKWFFDGKKVRRSPSRNPASKDVEAWDSEDGHPLGHFGVNIPWLAFCSGTFLRREGRIIPLPAAVLQHCPDRFAYRDVTTTFQGDCGLPKALDLFTCKELFLKSHRDWDNEQNFANRYKEWEEKTVLKLQEGILVFHYAVLESTNVLGREFPTRFEFFQTGREYEQDGNWFCQGIGRVKSIRASATPPSLGGSPEQL